MTYRMCLSTTQRQPQLDAWCCFGCGKYIWCLDSNSNDLPNFEEHPNKYMSPWQLRALTTLCRFVSGTMHLWTAPPNRCSWMDWDKGYYPTEPKSLVWYRKPCVFKRPSVHLSVHPTTFWSITFEWEQICGPYFRDRVLCADSVSRKTPLL
jgi:hypothetical protein